MPASAASPPKSCEAATATIPQDTSLPDIDLDAIEAAAIAAGGEKAVWRAVSEPVDSNDAYISFIAVMGPDHDPVIEFDTPDDEPAAERLCQHVAAVSPATTLRMVTEIRRLRAALKGEQS